VHKTLNAVSHLGPSSLPVVVAQLDERHATEKLLCWSGMMDREHTTSGSNEEDYSIRKEAVEYSNMMLCRFKTFAAGSIRLRPNH